MLEFTVIRTEWGPHLGLHSEGTSGPIWVMLWAPVHPGRLATPAHMGFQLPNELLLCPFRPLLLVGVDGAEDGAQELAAVLDGARSSSAPGRCRGSEESTDTWQHKGGWEPAHGHHPRSPHPQSPQAWTGPAPMLGFLNLGTTHH